MGNGVVEYLLGSGWWVVLLVLVLLVVLATLGVARRMRRRRVQAELEAQRLLAETLRELRDGPGAQADDDPAVGG